MTYTAPLDLYYWFVTFFAGNLTIFMAVAFLTIASLAAMFRMTGSMIMLLFAMFVIFLSIYLQLVYLVVIVIAVLGIGYTIARVFKF